LRQTPSLTQRLVAGALAGIGGTFAMTAVMSRLHRRLPPERRYPLPPSEIVAATMPRASARSFPALVMLGHFAYGAATGALLALASPRPGPATGALYGVGVWIASYLGWIPAARILKPATVHPPERNALMIAAHVVWGAATALAMAELRRGETSVFASGRRVASAKRAPDLPRARRRRAVR